MANQTITLNQIESHLWESANILRGPVDAADEIAFLALDCERLQAPALADVLLKTYFAQSQDTPPAALVHFYQSLRAGIRARIAIRHLDEISCTQTTIWTQRAMHWLALAQQHQDCISATMDPPS